MCQQAKSKHQIWLQILQDMMRKLSLLWSPCSRIGLAISQWVQSPFLAIGKTLLVGSVLLTYKGELAFYLLK